MKRGGKILKWTGIALGALFVLMIVAALVLPLVIDVDRFRPQVVETANAYLNGKLEMGKLQLSLWGQVKVQVGGFSLVDTKGNKVVSAQNVYFYMPFTSLISGSPRLTFAMKEPEVRVVKDKFGINLLSLVKTNPDVVAPAAPSRNSPAIPALVARARVGMQMDNAHVSYVDRSTELESKIDSLNVRIKDLSLIRATEIEVDAKLDTRMGKQIVVKGPVSLKATAQPTLNGTKFESLTLQFKAEMDQVEIRYGELFHKVPGVLCHLEGSLAANPETARILKAVARFHNAEIDVTAEAAGYTQAVPHIRFNMKSNMVSLKPWGQLVPMLKAYELSGHASLKGDASGPVGKLQYDGEALIQALKAKSPLLKSQPQIDAVLKVSTDKVDRMDLQLQAPGNDLRIKGTVISFTKPKVRISVNSSGMDLDQLVVFPKSKSAPAPSAESAAPPAPSSPVSAPSKEKPGSDYDALLDPLRESEVAAATDLAIDVSLVSLKAMNVPLERVEGEMTLQGLVASLKKARLSVFDASLATDASFALKPKTPTYQFGLEVAGLNMKKAVTSQFEMFKNTVFGIASFKMNGSGASFNPTPAKANLQAKGSLSVLDARFATLDIGRMAADAVNKALQGLEGKIPQIQGKKLNAPSNTGSGFEKMVGGFTIARSVFSMPDFQAISGKNKGFDLKGTTTVGIQDYRLDAAWDLLDTNNLTGARNLAIDVNGIRVENLLAEPHQPVRFPIRVGGTLFSPAPSYTAVPEALAKVALANVGRAAETKLKSEANARIQSEVKKLEQKAPPEIQKAIQDLGKHFKF